MDNSLLKRRNKNKAFKFKLEDTINVPDITPSPSPQKTKQVQESKCVVSKIRSVKSILGSQLGLSRDRACCILAMQTVNLRQ